MKKYKWIENSYVQEFEAMSECYIQNYPPLDLSQYENDRNFHFYELQNKLLLTYNQTGKVDKKILWEMFPIIEGVVQSLAKKKICTGCRVPDFSDKSLKATLIIMQHYEDFPYFRAEKLENVAFHKVREVFLDKNLQINEKTASLEYLMEKRSEKEKQMEVEEDE